MPHRRWARDFWGFNSAAQWFANRGYACLQVNYRGSSGYGKSFLHKGDKEWGVGAMQHDLSDAVQWAVDQKIADPDNVCIYGGSYGGYACLAGLTFTPDLYKCGVDIVGPSNIKTLLDSIPPYWGPLRNDMLKKIGDVDEDKAFNEKISPLYHVDAIKAPLLIGQGANDPRVKQAEADQIAFSMADKGIPVEYVLYPDEGHGWARPSAEINQCVRPAWRYYLLFWPPRRSARVLGVFARGVLGLLARTFDFRTGAAAEPHRLQRAHGAVPEGAPRRPRGGLRAAGGEHGSVPAGGPEVGW